MLDLHDFVRAVKTAVVDAAHLVREHNLQLMYSGFERVEREPPEGDGAERSSEAPPAASAPDGRPRGLAVASDQSRKREKGGGKGGRSGKGDAPPEPGHSGGGGPGRRGEGLAEDTPVLKPKQVAFQFPVDTPEGPDVHVAHIPAISLMGAQHYEITEFKISLKVSIAEHADERGENRVKLAFTGAGGGTRKSARGETESEETPEDAEVGTINVVIKKTDPPAGYYELIRGYDRTLRANIPG